MSNFKNLIEALHPEDNTKTASAPEADIAELDADQFNKIANLVYNKVMDELDGRTMDKVASQQLSEDLFACGDRLSEGFYAGLQKRASGGIRAMNTARTDGTTGPGPSAGAASSGIRKKLLDLDKINSVSTTGGDTMPVEGTTHPSAKEHPFGKRNANSPVVWERNGKNTYKKD